jgi:hypothetical protein
MPDAGEACAWIIRSRELTEARVANGNWRAMLCPGAVNPIMKRAAAQQAKHPPVTCPEIRNLRIFVCPLYPSETAQRMAAFISRNSGAKMFCRSLRHVRETSRTGNCPLDLDERSTWTANSQGNISVPFVLLTNTLLFVCTDRLTIGYKFKRKTVSNRIFFFGEEK